MKCILILIGQFQVWDGLITHIFVNNGIAKESNPLMESLVPSGDFLLLKILGALVCVVILWVMYKYFPKFALATASSLAMFYIAIISWNFLVFFNVI